MDFASNKFYRQVVSELETTYVMFLLEHRLIDSPAVRATFYATCERILLDDPLLDGDPMMYAAIRLHVRDVQAKILYQYAESVKQIFGEVIIINDVTPPETRKDPREDKGIETSARRGNPWRDGISRPDGTGT